MFDFSEETIKALVAFSFAHGNPKGPHITRFAMYAALKDVFRAWDGAATKTLAVGDSVRLGRETLGLVQTRYSEANYPQMNILDLPFEDGTFDFCISDQVLEHVEGDPFTAFRETARVVKAGGYLCHTTCFVNPVHGVPKDFWRFTPDSLRLMAESSGCTTIEATGWGNREAWALAPRDSVSTRSHGTKAIPSIDSPRATSRTGRSSSGSLPASRTLHEAYAVTVARRCLARTRSR
jgi:SAM-dependent methyltransferase